MMNPMYSDSIGLVREKDGLRFEVRSKRAQGRKAACADEFMNVCLRGLSKMMLSWTFFAVEICGPVVHSRVRCVTFSTTFSCVRTLCNLFRVFQIYQTRLLEFVWDRAFRVNSENTLLLLQQVQPSCHLLGSCVCDMQYVFTLSDVVSFEDGRKPIIFSRTL